MWRLSTGTYAEKEMKKFAMTCNYERCTLLRSNVLKSANILMNTYDQLSPLIDNESKRFRVERMVY